MAKVVDNSLKKIGLHASKPLLAIICILFGIILLIWPDMVGIIIGVFLLVQGLIILIEYLSNRKVLNASSP
jgi:uncharacterized membrane protein HdeD (DUF308 family)